MQFLVEMDFLILKVLKLGEKIIFKLVPPAISCFGYHFAKNLFTCVILFMI